MTTEELIKALRTKPSRDNRELLDEAADKLEAYYYHTTTKELLGTNRGG